MHVRRITREEVHRMSKRKKIYRYTTMGITALAIVSIVCGIGIYLKNNKNEDVPVYGREVTIGTAADIGISDYVACQYNVIQKNIEAKELDAMEYTVPDTCLSPVESVKGDNWYDSSVYVKSEDGAKPMSYFSDTVFIGDSRTEALMLYAGVPNFNGFCYKGLSVDKLKTDNVVTIPGEDGKYTCYEAIDMTDYDNYYLMFGMNELGWIYVESFINDFNNLIDYIYEHNPDATVYVESILPVSAEESEESDIYTQTRITEFNQALRQMCEDRKDVVYLDLAAAVTDSDGYLPDEASVDGIHCNADYCKRLIQYIRTNTYSKIK